MRFTSTSDTTGQGFASAAIRNPGVQFSFGGWFRPASLRAGMQTTIVPATTASDGGWGTNVDASTVNFTTLSYWNGITGLGPVSTPTGSLVVGSWTYLIVRLVSATLRWIICIAPTGVISHTSDTTNVSQANLNTWCIGGFKSSAVPDGFIDGDLAEVWATTTDIYPGGAQMPDWMVRQLAYRGPWSLPQIAANLDEYRALKSGIGSDSPPGETYAKGGISGNWTSFGNNGLPGPSTSPPPIIEPYQRGLILPRRIVA